MRATVIDIGSTKVVAAAFESTHSGDIKALAASVVEFQGVQRGAIQDRQGLQHAMRRAVTALTEKMGEGPGPATVNVGGVHVVSTVTQGVVPIFPVTRPISREDVLQVVNHSRRASIGPTFEQLQAIPREFRIDGREGILRPIGMSGGRLEVSTFLVMRESDSHREYESVFHELDLPIAHMVYEPLAAGLGATTKEELRGGVAVLDIGGSSSEFSVFHNGIIAYGRSLPIGGELVTSDISKLLKTSMEEAERLKMAAGSAWAQTVSDEELVDVLQLGQTGARPLRRRVLCEIIESRMRELAQFVSRALDESGYRKALRGGLVLTGGGSLMPYSDMLFSKVLADIGVHSGKPNVTGGSRLGLDDPRFSVAVGLGRYTLAGDADDLSPAGETVGWKDRIKTFWSLMGAGQR